MIFPWSNPLGGFASIDMIAGAACRSVQQERARLWIHQMRPSHQPLLADVSSGGISPAGSLTRTSGPLQAIADRS